MSVKPSYVLYLDEAGDPGVRSRRPQGGEASEWFVVGGVLVSAERDRDVVGWVGDMREAVRARQRTPLHYRNLSQPNRQRVCRMLGSKSARAFAVVSHKANMRDRQNPRMGKPLGRGEFYNWCLRLLLERVSDWCDRRTRKAGGPTPKRRVVFSQRGGHDYEHLRSYLALLDQQAQHGGAVLKQRRIVPGVLDPTLLEVRPHDTLAGLQLADIVASAFFQAANHRIPE